MVLNKHGRVSVQTKFRVTQWRLRGSAMTVDEILASGRYTDRRGKRWVRCSYAAERLGWFCPTSDRTFLTPAEMRLLIERDQHECIGLRRCRSHPVPNVLALQDDISGATWGHGSGVYSPGIG